MQEGFLQVSMSTSDGEAGTEKPHVPGEHHTAIPRTEEQKFRLTEKCFARHDKQKVI